MNDRAGAIFRAIVAWRDDPEAVRVLALIGLRGDEVNVPLLGTDTTEVEGLRAEVTRLTAELAKAKAAARKRVQRSSAQTDLFECPGDTPNVPGTVPRRDPSPDPNSKIRKGDPPGTRVEHDVEHPPPWIFETATSIRPDLSEFVLRTMWARFAKRRSWHKSETDARRHFRAWLVRQEDRPVTPHATATSPPATAEVRTKRPSIARPRVRGGEPVTVGAIDILSMLNQIQPWSERGMNEASQG